MRILNFFHKKIIVFQGGLGNQIFEYGFYLHLKKQLPNYEFYGYYSSKWLREQHNGLEINRVFNTSLPKTNKWITLVVKVINALQKIKCAGRLYSTDNRLNYNSIVFAGFWQNKIFYEELKDWIRFKIFELDKANKDLVTQIKETNSVSIHIRRGDYLDLNIAHIYGGICTATYYTSAIEEINKRIKNVVFFVFSDDIEWVKENLILQNVIYVSCNKKENSFYDMYLMSCCKGNIIANSSFSYWGAYLNNNALPLVIYPSKWYNSTYPVPNIFLESWVGI